MEPEENRGKGNWAKCEQVVVPKSNRENILRVVHELPLSEHLGVLKTPEKSPSIFTGQGSLGM